MHGLSLLTVNNPKTAKGQDYGYLTAILHLAPNTLSGFNTCPMASKGCAAACLNSAGRGAMGKIQRARIRKTLQFFNDRDVFMDNLVTDIMRLRTVAKSQGLKAAIRLNGTSDIRWETVPVENAPNIMAAFPELPFYDYTKLPNRRDLPENYSLTFSRSESNHDVAMSQLANGRNVAVVFGDTLPSKWNGIEVIDGTKHDLRFRDPSPVIVGLLAKGKGKKDTSGFVVNL